MPAGAVVAVGFGIGIIWLMMIAAIAAAMLVQDDDH
jgi:hypothetical protein